MNESNTKLILLSMTQEILDSFIHNTAIPVIIHSNIKEIGDHISISIMIKIN